MAAGFGPTVGLALIVSCHMFVLWSVASIHNSDVFVSVVARLRFEINICKALSLKLLGATQGHTGAPLDSPPPRSPAQQPPRGPHEVHKGVASDQGF